MNLKPYLTKARLTIEIAGLCAVVLGISWVAGQCRTWSKPKPTPAVIDQGTPVAGPSSAAPTINQSLIVARPDLTLDELRAAAKKYGLRLTTLAPAASKPSLPPSDQTQTPEAPAPAQTFPLLLAEESFKHAPSGADVDVSAWLPGFGERVDLRAVWRKWEPVPVAQAKMPVCQSGSFFANESKWEKEILAGYVCGKGGCGLGGGGRVSYLGPRTGAVTWGASATGAYAAESGGFGIAAFSARW